MKALSKLGNKLSNVGGRTALKISKHSPAILLAVGVTSILGGTVLACRATLKATGVIEEHRDKLEDINDAYELETADYSEKDYKRDLTVAYVQTGVNFVRLYAISAFLMIFGVSCLLKSYSIMRKRNIALMAAYKTLEEGFTQYRKRVVDEYGEEKDYMLRHGLKAEEVTLIEVGEDGKEKKVKSTALTDPTETSIYARVFDKNSREWMNDPYYNLQKIKGVERMANDLLKSRGNFFLNELYDMLGLERCPEGQAVGWVMNGDGDNCIDLGLYRDDQLVHNFVNGYTTSILLDPNVDGVVWEKI